MKRWFLAMALCAMTMATSAMPVMAAENNYSSGTDVQIQAEATTMNVTVPTSVDIIFNADGTDVVPDNFNITNNSAISGIHVKNIKFDGTTQKWNVAKDDLNMKTLPVGEKTVKFTVGKAGSEKNVTPESGDKANVGNAAFTQGEFDIAAEATENLSIKVERGSFKEAVAKASAYKVLIDFDFNA